MFRATRAGQYKLCLTLDGHHIRDSPISVTAIKLEVPRLQLDSVSREAEGEWNADVVPMWERKLDEEGYEVYSSVDPHAADCGVIASVRRTFRLGRDWDVATACLIKRHGLSPRVATPRERCEDIDRLDRYLQHKRIAFLHQRANNLRDDIEADALRIDKHAMTNIARRAVQTARMATYYRAMTAENNAHAPGSPREPGSIAYMVNRSKDIAASLHGRWQ
ncbi:hypothetical protein WJX72_001150 [[Myrmecia] bisecta]|uniref:Transposase n=1 Tax=[Myrmecia] bisecta TaxID=41462 RepID=A0AAW1R4W2_9CHLO